MEFGGKSEVSQGAARGDEERQLATEMQKQENEGRFKRQNRGRHRPSTESGR